MPLVIFGFVLGDEKQQTFFLFQVLALMVDEVVHREMEGFAQDCAELVYRLATAKRRSPPTFWLRGHNHTSSIGHINTAEDDLGRALLDFIDNPR